MKVLLMEVLHVAGGHPCGGHVRLLHVVGVAVEPLHLLDMLLLLLLVMMVRGRGLRDL